MGWFDNVIKVANPVTYLTGGSQVSGLIEQMFGGGSGSGGGAAPEKPLTPAQEREKDMQAGYAKGREIFVDDPQMKELKARREDLSKGYSGEELGALRATARGELAGQRDNDNRRLTSNLARSGVGGARGAAVRGAADNKYAVQNLDNERKMALDNAGMIRTGTNDLQDFIFRQKYGEVGTGVAYGQQGVADRTADKAAAANNQPQKKGFVGQFLDDIGF